jgi:NOL1/NOP2/fmu family ribosome biogenesis protein
MNLRKCRPDEAAGVLGYFSRTFGLEIEVFSGHVLYADEGGRIFLGPQNYLGWERVFSIGIPVAETAGSMRPCTAILRLVGRAAKRNVFEAGPEQAEAFMCGEQISAGKVADGHVIVKHDCMVLGCGIAEGGKIKKCNG